MGQQQDKVWMRSRSGEVREVSRANVDYYRKEKGAVVIDNPNAPKPRYGPMQLLMDDQANRETRAAEFKANLPTTMAMLATAATGGAAWPIALPVAAGSGYIGARLRGDSREDAVKSGALQGAIEGTGRMVGGALRYTGGKLYSGLLKAGKRIKEQYPDVAQQLLDARRLITRGGAEKAEAVLDESVAAADAMIDRAAQRGAPPVPAHEITPHFAEVTRATRDRVRIGDLPRTEYKRIADRIAVIMDTAKNGGVPLVEAQRLKRTAQRSAERAYVLMQQGHQGLLSTDDLLNAAVARGFKEAIEARVPGVAAQNALSQKLLGQSLALNQAVRRVENHLPLGSVSDLAALGMGHATGSTLVGAATKAATFAPTGSAAAILMNEMGKRSGAIPNALRLGQVVMVGGQPVRVLAVNHETGEFEGRPAGGRQ